MNDTVTQEIRVDNLTVRTYKTRFSMGEGASALVGKQIRGLLSRQNFVNIVFAAAPSQTEFLKCLSEEEGIAWNRVNAFHMDEYIGLKNDVQQTFGSFLRNNIFDKVRFHTVNYLFGHTGDADAECRRYTDLLKQFPSDIVCMGIGENGHIAFNDPHVADFDDPVFVKVVDLDLACRRQQVNDGCFDSIDDVPGYALTLTIPALLRARYIYCVVPGSNKADAVYHTLNSDILERYPATILRTHPDAVLFLDEQSASRLSA